MVTLLYRFYRLKIISKIKTGKYEKILNIAMTPENEIADILMKEEKRLGDIDGS